MPAPQDFAVGSIVSYLGNRANVTGHAADGSVEIRMLSTGSELSVPPDRLSSLTPPAAAGPPLSRAGLFAGAGLVAIIALAFLLGSGGSDPDESASAIPHVSAVPVAPESHPAVSPSTPATPQANDTPTPRAAPSYSAGVPPWVKRVQDVEAAYILPGNPDEEDPADRRDSVVIKYTSGDAGHRCTAMRALAGTEHGVIAYTPTGVAVDSNGCLSVKLNP
ncbi:hypothetical protein GCM10010215_22610 [Streptomyces virginiae]|uniref:Serine/threonine protein kinase n=1 Tax=Streptomyces virginiae TaxID=1961 RepID=A0ABQ3NUV2_STRVG|nr:hypothetical protein GCM10010215_22610 [Streptomyces virginiae]GHI16555.1 hypothetical protein Scinn_60180 [Streptomyces virginiae]